MSKPLNHLKIELPIMKFAVHEKEKPNVKKFPSSDYDLAKKFSKRMTEELPDFVKAVVLFGSAAKKIDSYKSNDIDILIIINDLTMIMSEEVVQTYRVITERTASSISKRFHITTLKMSTFWEYIRNGDPIAINMLREGVVLHDAGFFEPVQQLLFQGRIRPSKESIWVYFSRAPNTIHNADWHILQASLDLYWAVTDAAHAALMKVGEMPPSPKHLPKLVSEKLVRTGMVPSKCSDTIEFFYELAKKIQHRDLQTVEGKQYDSWKKDAKEFLKAMETVVEARP